MGLQIWWGEKYVDVDGEPQIATPDLVLDQKETNIIVMEALRGPIGPTGPMGNPGKSY